MGERREREREREREKERRREGDRKEIGGSGEQKRWKMESGVITSECTCMDIWIRVQYNNGSAYKGIVWNHPNIDNSSKITFYIRQYKRPYSARTCAWHR